MTRTGDTDSLFPVLASAPLAEALRPRTLTVAGVELSGVYGSGKLRPGAALQLSNGVLRADSARFRRFSGRALAASFQVRGGVIEVSDLQLETAGGDASSSIPGGQLAHEPLSA